jgi:hypothetical protein
MVPRLSSWFDPDGAQAARSKAPIRKENAIVLMTLLKKPEL